MEVQGVWSSEDAMHLCGRLAICIRQGHNALVYLDPRNDALALQNVCKGCAIRSRLIEGLLKQNLQRVMCFRPTWQECLKP